MNFGKLYIKQILLTISVFFFVILAKAQELDPRAYVKVPVRGTLLLVGYAYSEGEVLTDPTFPLENLEASINTSSLGVIRSFSLFGFSAQAFGVLPFGWAQATALINGQPQSAKRTGFTDMRLRLSVLLVGGKAVTVSEYAKDSTRTIVGTSLTIIAPTGEYFSDKLINLGTNRWSFKPEVALSQKISKRWMLDVYTGVWLFTSNNTFYPGTSVRTQDPLVAFQTHLSYNINLRTWAAFDATYYAGGTSTIDGIIKDDRLSNVRLGGTLVLPVGKRNTLKIAYSQGAIVQVGADFNTLSIGWSSTWFGQPKVREQQ